MDLHLKDKVIMVAGSSTGLGYGVAEAVAREGARVSIASRNAENMHQTGSILSLPE